MLSRDAAQLASTRPLAGHARLGPAWLPSRVDIGLPAHACPAVSKDTMKTEPSTRWPDVVFANCVVGPENPRKPERVARCHPREDQVSWRQGQHKGGLKVSKDSLAV